MRWTSSASCCSSATISLLISTVLSGSRNRLAPLPELPWTMPGIEARCSARTTSTYRPLRSVTICCWRYFDGVLARGGRTPACRAASTAASAGDRGCSCSSGLASSTTSPAGSILRRMSAISGSKLAAAVAIARRTG